MDFNLSHKTKRLNQKEIEKNGKNSILEDCEEEFG
jgi:hypothetical protein